MSNIKITFEDGHSELFDPCSVVSILKKLLDNALEELRKWKESISIYSKGDYFKYEGEYYILAECQKNINMMGLIKLNTGDTVNETQRVEDVNHISQDEFYSISTERQNNGSGIHTCKICEFTRVTVDEVFNLQGKGKTK